MFSVLSLFSVSVNSVNFRRVLVMLLFWYWGWGGVVVILRRNKTLFAILIEYKSKLLSSLVVEIGNIPCN